MGALGSKGAVMDTEKLEFVAFLTYNSIGCGDSVRNGIHRQSHVRGSRKTLVLQNSQGKMWATNGRRGHSNQPSADHGAAEVRAEIEKLWKRLERRAKELDHVVFYLGREGAELALERVAKTFPPEKVTILSCTCNIEMKKMAVKHVGLEKARFISCRSCGGQLEMYELYLNYMEKGELDLEPPGEK